MKPINNYVDFLNELEKGSKSIGVTDEFYDWLKNNIDCVPLAYDSKGPIGTFNGVRVYREEKKNDKKV